MARPCGHFKSSWYLWSSKFHTSHYFIKCWSHFILVLAVPLCFLWLWCVGKGLFRCRRGMCRQGFLVFTMSKNQTHHHDISQRLCSTYPVPRLSLPACRSSLPITTVTLKSNHKQLLWVKHLTCSTLIHWINMQLPCLLCCPVDLAAL